MKSFKQHLAEAIDVSVLAQWKQDSLAWSKNIKRIQTPEELYRVRVEYNVWIRNLEHFVYQKVLRKNRKDHYDAPTWWAKEAAEKFWHLYVKADPFRSDKVNSYDYKTQTHLPPDHPDIIQRTYDYWDKERSTKYGQYQRLAKAAFDALETYFRNEKVVPDLARELDTTVDGIPVRFELDETDEHLIKSKDRVIRDLKTSFQLLRTAGFHRVLRGLKVVIEDRFVANEGGHYDPATTSIHASLWGLGNSFDAVHVFTHECGHRWYYEFLTAAMRKDWENFCQTGSFTHVSDYSKKNASETFAETFSWYVRSLNMDPYLKSTFITFVGL